MYFRLFWNQIMFFCASENCNLLQLIAYFKKDIFSIAHDAGIEWPDISRAHHRSLDHFYTTIHHLILILIYF